MTKLICDCGARVCRTTHSLWCSALRTSSQRFGDLHEAGIDGVIAIVEVLAPELMVDYGEDMAEFELMAFDAAFPDVDIIELAQREIDLGNITVRVDEHGIEYWSDTV